MKYIGAALLLFGALAVSKLYASYVNARLREHIEYLAFLKHVRSKISCYLLPISDAAEDFHSDVLVRNGFLKSLREGVSVKEAYERTRECSFLSAEFDRLLLELFSNFGEGYIDAEMKNMDYTIERLSKECERQRAECQSKIKLTGTLVFAAALSFIILML